MTLLNIPDADHVLRYAGGRHVDRRADGSGIVMGSAFVSKPMEGNAPSVNWLEFLRADVSEAVAQVRASTTLTYGSTGKLARLNAGRVRRHIAENGPAKWRVDVVHAPIERSETHPGDPSHALLTNVPGDDDLEKDIVGDLIAECIVDVFPARV